ncbi:hypothetical protein VPLG_00167 [Vibrio phage eugene 12A10]|uniref:hypothetical protein n=1 Tax=Vibrio phage eugene 12A10 TaxID=573172 RepID=UPI000352010C|nr:hypothetical protein VPLG_00167 [Vibrio phage eugene 12A10]AGN51606.1 hypothetical protein VPLG_00167 [Vibrio phage eugene 12A10]
MCIEKINKFKEELEARSKPIDTRTLQLLSLYDFANKLGYRTLGVDTCQGFHNHKAPRESLKFVSFDTMKRWHNNPFNNYTFSDKMSTAVASSARIVERVKLQRTKEGIKVQDHYVKLVTNSREDYLKSQLATTCPTLTNEQMGALITSGLLK